MGWDARFHRWSITSKQQGNAAELHLKDARKALSHTTPEDWQWLETALKDPEKKWFVAAIFRNARPPNRFTPWLLKAAIMERNPSSNRYLIEPCTKAWGVARTLDALLKVFEDGTDEEKAGAASAAYWVQPTATDMKALEIRRKVSNAMLREFVRNSDVHVRQRIIPQLNLKPGSFPPELAGEVQQAIDIARAHPDEYIRHRVEIQTGASTGPLKPLPTTGSV